MGNNACACDCAGGTRSIAFEEVRDMKQMLDTPQKVGREHNLRSGMQST